MPVRSDERRSAGRRAGKRRTASSEAGAAGAQARAAETAGRLRTALGRVDRRLRRTRSHGALSPSQWEVLATVARRQRVPLSELAEGEGLNPTMLSRIAAKLEADGLVQRVADEHDARVAHLVVTPAGRRLHAAVRAERTDALLVALERLDDRDRQTLAAAVPALEALAEALREGRT